MSKRIGLVDTLLNKLRINNDWLVFYNKELNWWNNYKPQFDYDKKNKPKMIKFYKEMIKETNTHIKELKKLL